MQVDTISLQGYVDKKTDAKVSITLESKMRMFQQGTRSGARGSPHVIVLTTVYASNLIGSEQHMVHEQCVHFIDGRVWVLPMYIISLEEEQESSQSHSAQLTEE